MRRLNGKKLLLNYWLLDQLGAERTTSSQELPSATPKHVQTCMHVQNSFSLSLSCLLACTAFRAGDGIPNPRTAALRRWSLFGLGLSLSLSLSFFRQGYGAGV